MLILYILLIIMFLIAFMLIKTRDKIYGYNQKKDYCYDFKNPKYFDLSSPIDLKEYTNNQTLILKLEIKSTFFSKLFAPYVNIYSQEKTEKTFFEHSAKGVRYIDISSFVGGYKIILSSKNCKIVSNKVEIFDFENLDIKNKKVLIISPHADDAEIASFGLYSDAKESLIVTVTAGETVSNDYVLADNNRDKSRLKGKLRVHDALTIGMLGNVSYENSIALGYFNETIKNMYKNQDNIISSKTSEISDINYFRMVNHSKIQTNPLASSKWDSLVSDFVHIINSTKIDFIVTLHPQIDSNTDHQYITLALLEAMEELACKDIKLLTSTNHLTQNEIYPYGDIFSTQALVPRFDTTFIFKDIYSHQLSKKKQIYKFYALESMHDLREPLIHIGFIRVFRAALKSLRRFINGKEKSYYRRSVRTNEIFYVTDYKELKKAYKDIK
ncbi:PIG-L family deacetylase [Aliarcobacter vitoriensis]|uniref:Uncharacterized protein n=1 Tax=Aliarcobacter vitoriensis TaxID=2011099 RepID=A0A366MUA2_9BACT|nr:PIG-L family deacetylase [Aliarcobacter vitoriensis]RBQ29848.1 hypothetical protein CRU91_02680 [Aliarcobacter vitoriensis]